jgi:hypothetical protein
MTPKEQTIEHLKNLKDSLSFDEIEKEIYDLNKANQVWKNKTGRWFFGFAGVFAIISFLTLSEIFTPFDKWVYQVKTEKLTFDLKYIHGLIYGIWLLVPPLWFLYEYVWLFDDKFKLKSNHQADFKFTQELASKFWASLLILFGLILYMKYGYKP